MFQIPAERDLSRETPKPHVGFLGWQFERVEKGKLVVLNVFEDSLHSEPRLVALRSAYHERESVLSVEEVIKLIKPKTCSAPLYYTFVVAGDCLVVVISLEGFSTRDENVV